MSGHLHLAGIHAPLNVDLFDGGHLCLPPCLNGNVTVPRMSK